MYAYMQEIDVCMIIDYYRVEGRVCDKHEEGPQDSVVVALISAAFGGLRFMIWYLWTWGLRLHGWGVERSVLS